MLRKSTDETERSDHQAEATPYPSANFYMPARETKTLCGGTLCSFPIVEEVLVINDGT